MRMHGAIRLRPRRIVAPVTAVLALADIKRQVNVSHDDDDALLQDILDAAIGHVDGLSGILGRCMINQTWRYSFAGWDCEAIRIGLADVSAVTVKYRDVADVERTLDAAQYRLLETVSGGLIEWTDVFAAPDLFDRSDAVSVDVVAGYGATADDVPRPIRQAILLLAAGWYVNREAVTSQKFEEMPFAVQALLAPHCRNRLA